MMQKVYFHVDLDAFFSSVEQLDHPEYRGKPVIVGGIPGDRRSVVSTASYEAREYGVHSAMPLSQAERLCPNGIYVRPDMRRYQEMSQKVMGILGDFSPTVLQMSVDEAFIDMTGTERLFGKAEDSAMALKRRVAEETSLTVSVGVSSSMYVAKIASGYRKPDGLTVVPAGSEEEFMLGLPLDKLWGVGKKTQEHLRGAGLTSIKSIRSKSEPLLQSMFGKATGSYIYNAVRGNMDMDFGAEAKNHSISAETTYDFDLTDRYAIETAIMELSENVMYRMHRENVRSRTAALKIRYEDFTTVSVQETSESAVLSADDLFARCARLFRKKWDGKTGIRLLGVALEKVEPRSAPVQGDLFDLMGQKKARVEEAVFSMEDKNPGLKVKRARTLL